ncbi:hypothetical protein AB1Y20_009145 [Prymnesium parvum]|uniref:SNARE-complex protein Syntaxin-18 N-terminal domain-containing protein n=1 Tax=Prymnesium parvum TaxID=97485 RepID=A0AB34K0S2_PRYPA
MAVDRTGDFKASVRKRRVALGLPTTDEDLMPRAREKSPFLSDALSTLQSIVVMHHFLRDTHASYLLDDELHGMSDAERDEIDAECQRFIRTCSERIDKLQQQQQAAASGSGYRIFRSAAETQLQQHERAVVGCLYDRLKDVTALFDQHRGHRLRRAAEQRERRVGVAMASQKAKAGASAGGTSDLIGSRWRRFAGGGEGRSKKEQGDEGDESWATGWAEEALVPEEELELDEAERTQLLLENEALAKELECMVEQTREAEKSVLEISTLSHLFSSKVDEQTHEIEHLHQIAEQTSENVIKANQSLESAAKHSRDFRLFLITIMLVASFSLLFLDWYYD